VHSYEGEIKIWARDERETIAELVADPITKVIVEFITELIKFF
jgi:hypothetical protein